MPWSRRGTRSSLAGNGQSGLVSLGTMRVSASTPSVRIPVGEDLRLRGECAGRLDLEPQARRAGGRGAERDRAAHLAPLLARRVLQRAVVAELLDSCRSLATFLSSSGLTSLRDVELDPAICMPPSAMRDVAAEVGLDPPVRQQRGPRRHRDVAADVGALIERARGQLLHFAAELVAEQAVERAGEVAALVGKLAGDAKRAVQRGRDVQAGRRPATENGPRAMVQPMSALPSRSLSGFSFLPFNSRGACGLHRVADGERGNRDRGDDHRGARHRLAKVRMRSAPVGSDRGRWRPERSGRAPTACR